jgi:hypothetical protein
MELFGNDLIDFFVIVGIAAVVSFGLGLIAKKFTDKVDG